MVRARRQLNIFPRRAVAWLLLLVCAWMGSGGALHHTDTELTARAVPKAALSLQSSLHRQAAAVPADSCAACEWTQGLQGRTLTVCQVAFPLADLILRLPSLVTLRLARTARLCSARAPPGFSSVC